MYQELFEQLNLQTGDLLLFSSSLTWIDFLLKLFTSSKFTHIGVILKDPLYINDTLKGYYLLHSGLESFHDEEDGKIKYGVQISELSKVFDEYRDEKKGHLFVRRLKTERTEEFQQKMKQIHTVVHNKPYDLHPLDWLKAEFELRKHDDIPFKDSHRTDSFWCSALVAYTYVRLGYLDESIPWTFIAPNQFSSTDKKQLHFKCVLENDEPIRLNVQ